MATYTMSHYRVSPQRKAKKVFKTVSRVVDFSIDPVTDLGGGTTTWAVGDVLEVIGVRAKTTVVGVEIEVLKRCLPNGAKIQLGYGSDTDRWGTWKVDQESRVTPLDPASDNKLGGAESFTPLTFSSSDTIDMVLWNKIMTEGRIKVTAYLLEDAK